MAVAKSPSLKQMPEGRDELPPAAAWRRPWEEFTTREKGRLS